MVVLCELAGDLLSAYLDEQLPSHEALSLEKHLRVCPTCAAQLTELRAMRAMLGSLEELAPPPGFHAALHHRLVAATPAGTAKVASIAIARRRSWAPATRWVAAAAAAAVMAVSAGSYFMQQAAHHSPPEVAIGPDTTNPAVVTPGVTPSQTPTGPAVTPQPGTQPGTAPAPADKQPGTSGTSSPPPAGADGVTPPQPTKDDGVGLASSWRPTTAGVSLPDGTGAQAGGIQGSLVIYHADIELQASADEATYARLVSINEDLGGTIETVGDVQLSGSTALGKQIILRVPVARYQDAKAKVLAIAPSITVRDYAPADVTAKAKESQQQLNQLLAARAALALVSGNEQQLEKVQRDIDSCQQQLETYYDQAQLATLQIMVVE